ncbi:MAG: sialidase family protein [Bacteroidales bacterium]
MVINSASGQVGLLPDYLFRSGKDGYNTYRIPAIVSTGKGTLLAFAEGRKNGSSDTGDIDLVMKRSTDGGRTWSELVVLRDDGTNVCGNPAPVLDSRSGVVYLLSTWNLGTDREPAIIEQTSRDTRRVFVMKSSDDGITWSEPLEITGSVKDQDWTWYATGPCHGIQVTHGKYKGRLVIPCDHIEAGSKKYYSHVIYSDNGIDWKTGGTTPDDMVNECTIAELKGGRLMLNMRNYDRTKKSRRLAYSDDGGITWSKTIPDTTLVEPICQASMLTYFARKNKPVLLFLNPADKDSRRKMTIRMSLDEGRSWPLSRLLHDGPSAYSDMVITKSGEIICFYEAGNKSPYEGIVFQHIPLDDLFKKQ